MKDTVLSDAGCRDRQQCGIGLFGSLRGRALGWEQAEVVAGVLGITAGRSVVEGGAALIGFQSVAFGCRCSLNAMAGRR